MKQRGGFSYVYYPVDGGSGQGDCIARCR